MARRLQRDQEDEIVSGASAHLLRCRAQRVLCTWRVFAESAIAERLGQARAARHYRQVLLCKGLEAWCSRHRVMARKRQLATHCKHFRAARLLSACYAQWRRQVSGWMEQHTQL